MSIEAKIHLSKYETEVITDTGWILTKQAIIEKVYSFFGEMHEVYKHISTNDKNFCDRFIRIKNGKISKGENYLGLPYAILDYPAVFERDNIFAIRTMFWWGNFFSITLHVSGQDKLQSLNFSNLLSHVKEKDFFICVNEDEWQHNFDATNYVTINELDKKQIAQVCAKNFVKISKRIELTKWHETPEFLEKSYRELLELIDVSFPAGEKVL